MRPTWPKARGLSTDDVRVVEPSMGSLHGHFPEPPMDGVVIYYVTDSASAPEQDALRGPSPLGYREHRFLRVLRANKTRNESAGTGQNLRRRLSNANAYFARKADEVFIDESSLKLLATLYEKTVVPISELDVGTHGTSLARLTAANFCEVGVNVIYITEAGQQFVDSVVAS